MSNAADNTATNDARIITTEEQLSLLYVCFSPSGPLVGSNKWQKLLTFFKEVQSN